MESPEVQAVEPENQTLSVDSTRRMDMAEFKSRGHWNLVNSFSAGGAWMSMNGALCPNTEAGGFLDGEMMGQPIFSCGFCGYMTLVHHYTLQNAVTGELVNVGSECLHDILDTHKGHAIVAGIESLKRKVESDFKRVVYQIQLREWVATNLVPLNQVLNQHIDQLIAEDREHFWSAPTENVWQYDENGNLVMEADPKNPQGKWIPVVREVPVPEAKRRKDAAYHESRARNQWNSIYEKFVTKKYDWNPNTMAKSFKQDIASYKFCSIEVPKIRKLSDEEKQTIRKTQHEQIDIFIKKLGIKLDTKYVTAEEKETLKKLRKAGNKEEYFAEFDKIKEKYGFVGKSITITPDCEIKVNEGVTSQ